MFIIDDGYQSRLVIEKMLARYFTEVRVQPGTVAEAIDGINDLRLQVIFPDVQLNEASADYLVKPIDFVDLRSYAAGVYWLRSGTMHLKAYRS